MCTWMDCGNVCETCFEFAAGAVGGGSNRHDLCPNYGYHSHCNLDGRNKSHLFQVCVVSLFLVCSKRYFISSAVRCSATHPTTCGSSTKSLLGVIFKIILLRGFFYFCCFSFGLGCIRVNHILLLGMQWGDSIKHLRTY